MLLRPSTARGVPYQEGESMQVYVCTSSSGLYTVLMEEKELKWFAILPQWNLLVTNTLRTKKKTSWLVTCPSFTMEISIGSWGSFMCPD